MEIREGIKYKTSHGEMAEIFAHSKVHNFYAKFSGGGISINYASKEWIEDFQTCKLQLIEYPYKVGDWVYFLGTEKSLCTTTWKPGRIQQITGIRPNALDFYNSSNRTDQFRPCFKEEIPNYKQKVVKENYDYLIPILTKLNE